MKRTFLAALFTLSFSTAAHASGCDVPQTGFDNVYCFAKVYMDLDKQLNTNYAALTGILKQNEKIILRASQRAWIDARNKRCYYGEDNKNSVNIDCALATTRQRIQFLSDRLAECRATGCNLSRLRQGSENLNE